MTQPQQGRAQGHGSGLRGVLARLGPETDVSVDVLRQQVSLMYQHLPAGLVIGASVAIVLGLFFMTPGMVLAEGLWILCYLLLDVFRYTDCLARRNQPLAGRQLTRARACLQLGALLQGLLWALAGTVMLPPSPLQQLFLIAVISGMTAGAVVFLSPIWSTYALYAVPAIVPLCFRLLAGGLPTQKMIGCLGLGFTVSMLLMAARVNRWLTSSLVAAEANAALTLHLQGANELLIKYHSTLEAAVGQRTLELCQANERLRREIAARDQTALPTQDNPAPTARGSYAS